MFVRIHILIVRRPLNFFPLLQKPVLWNFSEWEDLDSCKAATSYLLPSPALLHLCSELKQKDICCLFGDGKAIIDVAMIPLLLCNKEIRNMANQYYLHGVKSPPPWNYKKPEWIVFFFSFLNIRRGWIPVNWHLWLPYKVLFTPGHMAS